jgi:hypothetical protein
MPLAERIGSVQFWQQVFPEAAARGPRMIGALLYQAPPGFFEGFENRTLEFLSVLRSWPVL